MMEETIIQVLSQGGPMALFAAYLVWQTREQQKRIDGWIGQVGALDEKAQAREDKLRERYDEVILKIEGEKGALTQSLIDKMGGVMEKLSQIEQDIKLFSVRIKILEKDRENG